MKSIIQLTKGEIFKYNLSKEDVIIIKLDIDCVGQYEIENIHNDLKKLFPENEILLLDKHSDIQIVRKDEAEKL